MYVGSANILKNYDQCLLNAGYTIEELIDKASDCLYPHFTQYQDIAIFVGPGNNGGDGLSLALKLIADVKNVDIYYIGDVSRFSKGNQYYFKQCQRQGITMHMINDYTIDSLAEELSGYDVVVDAFFGFGLHSTPRGLYQQTIDTINRFFNGDVIAIDIPTGLNCNTGIPYQSVVYATKTIALTALKEGYLNPDSQIFTGEVVVETLDVPDYFHQSGLFEMVDEDWAVAHLRKRRFDGYKNIYGVDLLITGSSHYRGAPVLCAKAAVNAGAGIVKVLSHKDVTSTLHLSIPEAIGIERPLMLRTEDLRHHQAILLGCGIGLDEDAYRLVNQVFTLAQCPLIVDADALTIISKQMGLLDEYSHSLIITPHLGEFKRLMPLNKEDDLMEAAYVFAREHHVITVLKGPYTMVTDGHKSYRIAAGNPAMAVGGMGDTLAGIITALIGQGYDPLEGTALAVYLHGLTGDVLSKKTYTVLPEKVSEALPMVMKTLADKRK